MELSLVLIALVLCSTAATLVTCSSAGFHMELTHVDSKGSYTAVERVQRAMASSRQRLASFADVSVPVHWNSSQYIAEYLIGNPPQRAEAIVDTGSDLIWTQCSTCSLKGSCIKQGLPYYNASNSDSFHPVACNDTLCLANLEHSCTRGGGCAFGAFYGAGVASSHLFVGASASLSGGSPVMSMSFVQVPEKYPFYYVPLIGISVGHTRVSIPPTVFALKQNGSGGVIIDSGNPTTALAHGAYWPLSKELRRQLNGSLVSPPANMVLPPENYWVRLDNSTSCMVMHTSNGMSVIGNFQLQNMHLLYDLAKDELSFQRADCSSL